MMMYAAAVALSAAISAGHGPTSGTGGGKSSRDFAIAFEIRMVRIRTISHTSGNVTTAEIAAMA